MQQKQFDYHLLMLHQIIYSSVYLIHIFITVTLFILPLLFRHTVYGTVTICIVSPSFISCSSLLSAIYIPSAYASEPLVTRLFSVLAHRLCLKTELLVSLCSHHFHSLWSFRQKHILHISLPDL